MREKGYSWPRIGELIGTTGDACRNRMKRLSKPKTNYVCNPWSPAEKQRLDALYNQTDPKLTLNQIAKILGRTYHAVKRMRQEMCIQTRKPKYAAPPKRISKPRNYDGKQRAPKFAVESIREAERVYGEACAVGFDNGGLTFDQITGRSCRFIKGDKHNPRYCEHHALPGKSWCEFHHGVVFK